ncbi:hypothetical protein [Staphylococcus americanisciuri]|uniref:Phage protein n=1 Tax=Staphylococcus americanisciuri TaxID=2973940 RepID=A0ABT2F260_9STAP|nr:hypothetical protein [Staphylococcus americanisciuri]MCS4486356.1 hypothetical protein [Staphylococcus americanisciuri]
MSAKERFYDTKWLFENHFKDDETKDMLIRDALDYIEGLEAQVRDLEITIEAMDEEV